LLLGNKRKTSQHYLNQNAHSAKEWANEIRYKFNEEVKLIPDSLPKKNVQINLCDGDANTEKETVQNQHQQASLKKNVFIKYKVGL